MIIQTLLNQYIKKNYFIDLLQRLFDENYEVKVCYSISVAAFLAGRLSACLVGCFLRVI